MLNSGPILFAFLLGILLTAAASWVVAGLYRRRMVTLMRGGPPPDSAAHEASAPFAAETPRLPATMDLAANQRASMRFMLLLTIMCLLMNDKLKARTQAPGPRQSAPSTAAAFAG